MESKQTVKQEGRRQASSPLFSFCMLALMAGVAVLAFGPGPAFCPQTVVAVLLGYAVVSAIRRRSSRVEPKDLPHLDPEEMVAAAADAAERGGKRAWTEEEKSCVTEMLRLLEQQGVAPPPEELLLQVAWSRKLNPDAAAVLWRQHLEAASRYGINAVSDEDVRQAYSMGFCERSGSDVDGRPMIWVRLALCEVAKLSPSLAVRNTWLAHDATLCGSEEANRNGLCFVYDCQGVGRKNISFNPNYLSAAIRGATSHPMHLSRVWILDAPALLMAAWRVASTFLPQHIRDVVHFIKTGDRADPECFAPICKRSELPPYLGGDASRLSGTYAEWMFERLQGQPLAY